MNAHHSTANRQAIVVAKRYMGHFAWPTVLLTAAVVVGFVGNLAAFAAGLSPWWLATLVYAVLTYMSYTPLHEATHGNIHGDHANLKWLNDLCGYVLAPLIMIPYASHTVEHFTHHRYTNQRGKDPDFMLHQMGEGALAFVITGLRFFWMQNNFLYKQSWHKASPAERGIYLAEIALAIVWRLAVVVWVATPGIVALLVVGYLLGAFFTAYWFAYRPHLPYTEAERYRNTCSMIMPKWMKAFEWFWLGQNLHSIHHLFPRVPFYHYHAVHRQIEPILRDQKTPIIGIFSREPIRAAEGVESAPS